MMPSSDEYKFFAYINSLFLEVNILSAYNTVSQNLYCGFFLVKPTLSALLTAHRGRKAEIFFK